MKAAVGTLPLLFAFVPLAPGMAAELSNPVASPVADTTPPAADTPYPGGTIALEIDATDIAHNVWRVTERVPVAAGTRELTLLYPEWLPGEHAANGPIYELAKLHFFADGKEIAWDRDPFDVYAFHLKLPEGTREVTATFVDTSPVQSAEGRITMTREMLNLQWNAMSLYPAGHYVRQITVKPTVTVPEGWSVVTALDGMARQGGTVTWDPVRYDVLVDSPVFAGKYAKRWDLGQGIHLDAIADKPDQLAIKSANLDAYRRLADQAVATFGSRHYDHYDLLLALTEKLGDIGLEHHRSSENSMHAETLVQWDPSAWDRNVLAHELTHSWNGKFRRPEGLWTPDYRQPMKDDLLWVYEGQTQFWGYVLAARSGVQPKDVVLGYLAKQVGRYSMLPGRQWRPVEDTTRDPVIANRRDLPYSSLMRSEDYYNEGMFVWLEADQVIRAGTGGKKGLDDFAKAFFGIRDGDYGEVTYGFDDVVAALDAVYHYDWASFLRQRLYAPNQPAPLGGIERGGYHLAWKEEPNPYDKQYMAHTKGLDLFYSLGAEFDKDGKVTNSVWDSPAFNAGLVKGATVVAVNGEAYSSDELKDAVTAAKTGTAPITLLVKRGTYYQELPVEYHGGLRYPWLERTVPGKVPAPLDDLLVPRKTN
jgi:predicted metalloprotease with PDZ domain